MTKKINLTNPEWNAICTDSIYDYFTRKLIGYIHVVNTLCWRENVQNSENYSHDPVVCPRCPFRVRRTCPARVPWRCAQIHRRRGQRHHRTPPSAGTQTPLSDSLSWTWWPLRCLNINTDGDINKNRFNGRFVESSGGWTVFTLFHISSLLHSTSLYCTHFKWYHLEYWQSHAGLIRIKWTWDITC